MNSTSWSEVVELFHELCDIPADEREQRFALAGSHSAAVLAEVRSLLEAHDNVGDRFSKPAAELFGNLPHDGSEFELTNGMVLGAYEIVRRVGEGGMGAVYEAVRRDDTAQRVAIKTIGRASQRDDLMSRFANERRILASLQHKNIAALYDAGVTPGGVPYFVMEFVDGNPIDVWANAKGLSARDRLILFRQVCSAVQHAHGKFVAHRDLKPDNILVTDDGTVKLLDFGIAKLVGTAAFDLSRTLTGFAPLTAAYASPEQLRGESVSTQTDVYSMGVLLYRLLTGVTPFADVVPMTDFLEAVMHTAPTPPSKLPTSIPTVNIAPSFARLRSELDGEIDAIVLMALRKEPERRYASAEALNADIQRYLNGQPVSARADTTFYRFRKFVGRQRLLVSALSIAAMAIGTATTVAFVQRAHARRDAVRAERIAQFLQDILTSNNVSVEAPHRLSTARLSLPELLDSAASRLPRQMDDDPEARISLHALLGAAFIEQSERTKGMAQLDSAIALAERQHSDAGVTVGGLLVMRGEVTGEQRPDSALPYLRRALNIFATRHLPDTAARYVRAWRGLASSLSAVGQIVEAESTYRRVLALESRRGAAGKYGLAVSLGSIGMAQHNRGMYDSASASMRAAVNAYDEASSAPSIEETMQLYSLSTHLISRGRQAEALPFLQRAQTMAALAMAPDNAVFMQLAITLADVESFMGDTAAAHRDARDALARIPSLPDGTAVQAFITQWWYARMLRREQNWQAGEPAARRQFAAGLKAVGSFPHYLSDSYWLLGATLSDMGKYAEAAPLLRESVVIGATKLGPSSPRVIRGRRDLAVLMLRSGNAVEAAALLAALPPLTADSARTMGVVRRR